MSRDPSLAETACGDWEIEAVAERAQGLTDQSAGRGGPSEYEIVERIYAAVMEQRLPPRTKLSESMLCESFGVGRMRVRQALLLLASQGIVDLHSNRGAFVASPDAKEARDVFEARLALEPSIVRQVARQAQPMHLKALDRHIAREAESRAVQDRRETIRLSGEFHVRLAAATGNAVLVRMMRELVTRTTLIIGLFGTSGPSHCEDQEHARILDALRLGDGERAAALMREHLAHIEADLDLTAADAAEPDLARVLGGR